MWQMWPIHSIFALNLSSYLQFNLFRWQFIRCSIQAKGRVETWEQGWRHLKYQELNTWRFLQLIIPLQFVKTILLMMFYHQVARFAFRELEVMRRFYLGEVSMTSVTSMAFALAYVKVMSSPSSSSWPTSPWGILSVYQHKYIYQELSISVFSLILATF